MTPNEGARELSTPVGEGPSSIRLARNALNLVFGQAATMVLGILFSAMLGRRLGAADFGLFFLINSLAGFALVLVDWGQQYFAIREVARSPERGGELLGSGLVLRCLGTLLVCLPAGLGAWALGYDRRTIWYSLLFLVCNLPLFLAQNFGVVFRGKDRMGLDASVSVINRAAGLVFAFAALSLGFGLGGVVTTQLLAGLAALGVALLLYPQVKTGRLRFTKATALELLRGGTPMLAISLAIIVQPYLDAVLLSKLVPKEAMGWYGAAKSILGTLLAPSAILGAAAFPVFSRTSHDPVAFRREVATAQRPLLWLGGLVGVGTWVCADLAVSVIYGSRGFAPAGIILKVFGLGMVLVFEDTICAVALMALGRARAFAAVKVVTLVIGVGLELALIPYFQHRAGNGGLGVSLAFVLTEVLVFGGALFLMPRGIVGMSLLVDGGRAVGCALATGLFFAWMPHFNRWLSVPVCIVVFTVLTAASGLLRREDLQLLKALLQRRDKQPRR
jgi:O-antigen/teichoic acid export membrane protein